MKKLTFLLLSIVSLNACSDTAKIKECFPLADIIRTHNFGSSLRNAERAVVKELRNRCPQFSKRCLESQAFWCDDKLKRCSHAGDGTVPFDPFLSSSDKDRGAKIAMAAACRGRPIRPFVEDRDRETGKIVMFAVWLEIRNVGETNSEAVLRTINIQDEQRSIELLRERLRSKAQ